MCTNHKLRVCKRKKVIQRSTGISRELGAKPPKLIYSIEATFPEGRYRILTASLANDADQISVAQTQFQVFAPDPLAEPATIRFARQTSHLPTSRAPRPASPAAPAPTN
ncbi:hypothetical protein EVAR_62358_1 [Eumeta japonica]|uniref:Uncharacterized protein n=1 Tax=Eumeta variegata TaxID=151549 RepID=A0A4C1ZZ35_EUMVA|nr:hypothetical protein EVAR_62358_1 [Eumeta japonica]